MRKQRRLPSPLALSSFPADVIAAAFAEDVKVQKILREARNRASRPMVTAKAVREGVKFMAKMHRASERALRLRIDRKEVLTRAELVERIGGNRQWVSYAIRRGGIFSLRARSGVEYFPSFFADSLDSRRALSKVTQALADTPGPSKYYFFISRSLALGMTPLEALAEGRIKAVLVVAAGFAKR